MNIRITRKTISSSLILSLLSACAPQQSFNLVDPSTKRSFLGKSWVFSGKVRVAATGVISTDNDSSGETVNQSGTGVNGETSGSIGAGEVIPDGGSVGGGDVIPDGGSVGGGDVIPVVGTTETLPQPPVVEAQTS
ncbi:MAG: hypothetical protein RJB66_279 [Pseudomonadota bacterium]|jgi:hypothetical protein